MTPYSFFAKAELLLLLLLLLAKNQQDRIRKH